jgi:serine/threonine protein kinase
MLRKNFIPEKFLSMFKFGVASDFCCNSRKSVLVELNVPSKRSFFNVQRKIGEKFDLPVTDYFFKFVVISDDESEYIGDLFGDSKYTTIMDNYFNEVRHQDLIWKKTYSSSHGAICSPVLYDNYMDAEDAINVIDYILEFCPDLKGLHFLKDVFENNPNYYMGIISSQLFQDVNTLNDYCIRSYCDHSDEDDHNYDVEFILIDVLANIIRIYIDMGIIHYDLHKDNILVKCDMTKCYIVDFDLSTKVSETDKRYKKHRDQFIKLSSNENSSISAKKDFVVNTLKYIIVKHNEIYDQDVENHLENWCGEFLKDRNLMLNVFDRIVQLKK